VGRSQRNPKRGVARPPVSPPSVPAAGFAVQQHIQQGTLETRTYASPLMSPADMKRFDELVPGGAREYFDWVREQTAHRQRLESEASAAQIATEKRGQLFAFAIALTSIIGAVALGVVSLIIGSTLAIALAIALVGFPVVGIVGIFVTGRFIGRKENVEKTRILAGKPPDQT